MKTNEFYSRYANTPLDKRGEIIRLLDDEFTTLDDIYRELIEIDDKIRPDIIRQQELLSLADLVFIIRKDEKEM